MYHRTLTNLISVKIGKGKAVVLIGPKQVGKTTLVKSQLVQIYYLFLDADDPTVSTLLHNPNTEQLKSITGNHKVVFIGEAQRISGIGITLKLIVDLFKEVQLIVSGYSYFELTNELNEPLTGRKWEYELLPIIWAEYENKHGYLIAEQQLENRLLYGFYPDVLNNTGEEIDILKQLVNSYLYRDILAYSKIRKPEVLEKLVQALTLQLGNEVNYNELSQTAGANKNTIASYIDILQKGYVIFKLGAYSQNLRNEIKKTGRFIFTTMGFVI